MKKGTIKLFAAFELYEKKVLFLFYGQLICIDSYCFLEATSLRSPSECSAWNMGKLFEMQTCQFQKIPSTAAHKNYHIPHQPVDFEPTSDYGKMHKSPQ
jgi:hypothetical protein